MRQLLQTQAFHNFIEESYKCKGDQKSRIAFFKQNVKVFLRHSFRKVQKEQDKLIQEIVHNMVFPAKFRFSHILNLYKKDLKLRNAAKLKDLIEHSPNSFEKDYLELLLIEEIAGNKHRQLSVIDSLNSELLVKMQGIEYECIKNYRRNKVLKKSRSDRSVQGGESSLHRQSSALEEGDMTSKSRNFPNDYL